MSGAVRSLLPVPDPALVAAVAAAAALLVSRPPRVRHAVRRLGGHGAPDGAAEPSAAGATVAPAVALVVVALGWTVLQRLGGAGVTGRDEPLALGRALVAALWSTGLPGVAPAAAVATAVAVRARRRGRRAATALRQRRSVTDGVLILAAELRAGTPALRALDAAARESAVLLPVARVGGLGGDVARAFAAAAGESGAAGLAFVGAAWSVSSEMGAGLADTMDELVEILRSEDLAGEQTVAALAAPRATARLLCVLPAAGLGLGALLGTHPWLTLTRTSWGPLISLVAVVLAGTGLEWVERLAATAEDPGRATRGRR